MTPATLLAELHRRGATVRVEGDTLRVVGSRDVLTPDMVEELRANKTAILELLSRPTAQPVASSDLQGAAAAPAPEAPPAESSHGPEPPPPGLPRRTVCESLVRQVAQRLRSGRPVLLSTDCFGPVVLAPSQDAARRVEARRPGVPVFLPYEWRALLDCESPDEIEALVSVKRYLGAQLLPGPRTEEVRP